MGMPMVEVSLPILAAATNRVRLAVRGMEREPPVTPVNGVCGYQCGFGGGVSVSSRGRRT